MKMLGMQLASKDEFKALVAEIEAMPGYVRPKAFAIGIARRSKKGQVLDVTYPCPNYNEHHGTAALFTAATNFPKQGGAVLLSSNQFRNIEMAYAPFLGEEGHKNIDAFHAAARVLEKRGPEKVEIIITFLYDRDLEAQPKDVYDAYLRLHLLSHRKVRPNEINVVDIFKVLPNVSWTSDGPMAIDEVDAHRLEAMAEGRPFFVRSQDKFPQLVDYVSLPDVRITAAHCARLGAYLGPGTTIMPSGFVNFNAGTEQDCMIEGRLSQGVWMGAGSDLGGGASTMGTLSGGGKERVRIGRHCLIGANAGTGIALGDGCTIEAGLYVTAAMWVMRQLPDGATVKVKARELSGQPNLLFIRNSLSGQVEVRDNPPEKHNKPNVVLHKNA